MSTTQASNDTAPRLVSKVDEYHYGLITLVFLIIICNLLAIQIYIRHKAVHRNCSNVLLVSLAISHLILGVVYLPILIFCESQWNRYSTVNQTFVMVCRTNYFVGNLSTCSTIFHIIALTIEKYTAVLHPFQRLSVSTSGTYRKILTVVWFLSLVFAFVPVFWMYNDPLSPAWNRKFDIYGIVQAAVFLGFASVVLVYCYIRMFVQIHIKLSAHAQVGRVQTKARNDRKTAFIFVLFFVIFVVGWTPWFVFNLKPEKFFLVPSKVKDFLVSLRHLAAVINPLLYSFIKNDYKQAVQADFRNLCSSCPAPIGFQRLIQTSTGQRNPNNNNSKSTMLSTGFDDVQLKKIESIQEPCETFGSVRYSSQAENTDL